MASIVWNKWLPEHLYHLIKSEEPERYAAIVHAVQDIWTSTHDAEATLPFIPLVKNFISARTEIPPDTLQQFIHLIFDIIYATNNDLAAQSRWAQELHRILRTHRRRLPNLVIPWRPLFNTIRSLHMLPSSKYEGYAVKQSRLAALVKVAHRARRFFPPAAAAEIWEQLRPGLVDVGKPESQEALGWLAMLLPTHSAAKGNGNGGSGNDSNSDYRKNNWAEWAQEWADIWEKVAHGHVWDCLWYSLFARLAKHDIHDLIDWLSLMPRLATHWGWAFEVPVGAATASPPFYSSTSQMVEMIFNLDIKSRSGSIAKSIVYLLGRTSSNNGTGGDKKGTTGTATMNQDGDQDNDVALGVLLKMTNLLEQYMHPSNGGRWSGTLSNFLKELSRHFCKRLVSEHYVSVNAAHGSDTEDDYYCSPAPLSSSGNDRKNKKAGGGESGKKKKKKKMAEEEEEEDIDDDVLEEDGGGEGMESDDSGDSEEALHQGGGTSSSDDEEHLRMIISGKGGLLPAKVRTQVASILIRLASTAQFSKDKGLSRVASLVFSSMSYIEPHIALPVVNRHFIMALEMVTAAHNLSTAIQTMSLCVRPLLIAGLPPPLDDDGTGTGTAPSSSVVGSVEARAAGAAAVAAAMMATLPGIDANDPPKSLAAFRFYCCVLSSVGRLPSSSGTEDDEDHQRNTTTKGGASSSSSLQCCLPLYTEEWCSELLDRIFTIISNLDSPQEHGLHKGGEEGGSASDDSSFLLEGKSMFRPLIELLFARLPPSLRVTAIKRTARFLLDNTLSSVTGEAAVLCNAMAWLDPENTSKYLMDPLVKSLEQDADHIIINSSNGSGRSGEGGTAAVVTRLSKVQERAINWRVTLMSSTAFHMGRQVLHHKDGILKVLKVLSEAPSQSVQDQSTRALSAIFVCLCTSYPINQYIPCPFTTMVSDGNDMSSGVEAFVDKFGYYGGVSKNNSNVGEGELTWHMPDGEEVAFAEQLMQEFLLKPAAELSMPPSSSSSSGGGAQKKKERLRILLLQMESTLNGLRTSLPDYHHNNSSSEGTAATLVGHIGSTVGTSSVRSTVTSALLSAFSPSTSPRSMTSWMPLQAADDDTLKILLRTVDALVAIGSSEYTDSIENHGAWTTDERWMHEPAIAGLLYETCGISSSNTSGTIYTNTPTNNIGGGYMRWRRRRPRWLVSEKVYLSLEWRASQAAYRQAATTTLPRPSLPSSLHPLYRSLLAKLVIPLTMHTHIEVREGGIGVVERCMKRHPALQRGVARPVCAALAKLVATPEDVVVMMEGDEGLEMGPGDIIDDLRKALCDVAEKGPQQQKKKKKNGGGDGDGEEEEGNGNGNGTIAAATTSESEQEQALAIGATKLLSHRALFRLISRDWNALHAVLVSVLSSAAHTGTEAQESILGTVVMVILRFVPPPIPQGYHSSDGTGTGTGTTDKNIKIQNIKLTVQILMKDILMVAKSSCLHWRYTVLANTLLLLFFAEIDADIAVSVAQHYLALLTGSPGSAEMLSRQIASAGLNLMTMPYWHAHPKRGSGEEVLGLHPTALQAVLDSLSQTVISSNNTSGTSEIVFWKRLFDNMTAAHPLLSSEAMQSPGRSRASRQLATRDNITAQMVITTMYLWADWPSNRPAESAHNRGAFVEHHARTVAVLASLAKGCSNNTNSLSVIEGLRQPVEEALGRPQDADPAAFSTSAEVVAGLLAAGYGLGSSSDDTWVVDALQTGLSVASLENTDIWHDAVLGYVTRSLLFSVGGRNNGTGGTATTSPPNSHHHHHHYYYYYTDPRTRAVSIAQYKALLSLIFHPISLQAPTTTSSIVLKRLMGIVAVAIETFTEVGCVNSVSPAIRVLKVKLMEESDHLWNATITITTTGGGGVVDDDEEEEEEEEEDNPTTTNTHTHTISQGGLMRFGDTVRRMMTDVVDMGILACIDDREGDAEFTRLANTSIYRPTTNNNNNNISMKNNSEDDMMVDVVSDIEDDAILVIHHECSSGKSKAMLGAIVTEFGEAVTLLSSKLKTSSGGGGGGEGSLPSVLASAGEEEERGGLVTERKEAMKIQQALEEQQQQGVAPMITMTDDVGVLIGSGSQSPSQQQPQQQQSVAAELMANPDTARAIEVVAFAANFIVGGLNGDVGPYLTPWIVKMLPGLLRLQELIPTELQSTAAAVRKALAEFKYLPLWGGHVDEALDAAGKTLKGKEKEMRGGGETTTTTTTTTTTEELSWPERASALVYLQYFWFRHVFLLGQQGEQQVLNAVLHALSDTKLEVRDLAAATLSGMVKGLSVGGAEELRREFLQRALLVFPSSSSAAGRSAAAAAVRRKRLRQQKDAPIQSTSTTTTTTIPPPPPPHTMEARHAVVLGLRSFVLSSPYDIPPWLPDILMSLVRLAAEPPPIKTTVTKTLAEFRRTHNESCGGTLMRDVAAGGGGGMTEEQWEMVRDVATSATSYFV